MKGCMAIDRQKTETVHWHAVFTASRAEKKVRDRLEELGVECFLPVQTVLRQWTYRKSRTVRCRIYGVFLLALGLLTLILGLMPPRTTDVIIVGGAVIIAGLLEFALARGRTPPRIPASCKKEARKALSCGGPLIGKSSKPPSASRMLA